MWVKICGTTSEQDALLAVAMGADALGFVFAPSPRQVSTAVASDIVKRLPPEIVTVGVFRDEAPERVVDLVRTTGLRGAQLSGRESAEESKWVRRRLPFLIKGFSAGSRAVADAAAYGADLILLDAPSPGSGEVFDWSMADAVPDGQRLVLAGGLTPENVAGAIAQVNPWGVDVATGVEDGPGRKDARKLRAFIAAARAAAPAEYEATGEAPYDWRDDG
ncbi:MAG TPA: phosphoribosylanthranilate isomerase [Acidimicrobiales bacterium]